MDKHTAFKSLKRRLPELEEPEQRIKHFKEFEKEMPVNLLNEQSTRCMDCGVPFCHSACPLGNKIPDFNDAVMRKSWQEAYEILSSTNNFPEFTGRICPAPCEGACVLGINNEAVTIEYIEKVIAEKAFENGWVKLESQRQKKHEKIAIIGSGPSGLSCAEELTKRGYEVTVYERDKSIGGLLRYGIPDFKLQKNIIDRRINVMLSAGIKFETNVEIGVDVFIDDILNEFDVIVLCIGSTKARNLDVEGRSLNGIFYAMDFLKMANKNIAGEDSEIINCEGKDVLVIGGGDTGSDCIGTAHRLAAKSVTQFELLSKPPASRSVENPWPQWPLVLRKSSSHSEGGQREWCILTKRFVSDNGKDLSGVEIVDVKWLKDDNGHYTMSEVPESERFIPCQIAFIAIGFSSPILTGKMSNLGLSLDDKDNIQTHNYQTSIPNIFAAGDARIGQSLVVYAIAEGRKVADSIHDYLYSKSENKFLEPNFEDAFKV